MRTVVTSNRNRLGKSESTWVMAVRTRLPSFVSEHVCGEYPQGALDQCDRTIRVPARPAPAHLAEPPDEAWHEIRTDVASSQKSHIVGNGRKAEDAGPTLSGTL